SFQTFDDFLAGMVGPNRAVIGSGIADRSLRTIDYALFVQDDWKLSTKLTLNLGLRYELAPPFYDTRGRLNTFDPALYVPRMELFNGLPAGPPIGGLVQAGNVIPAYDRRGIPNVGKRLLHTIDPNNFGPRVGLAYSPLISDRVVLRAGYGIFYSRASFQYAILAGFGPPMYRYAANPGPRAIADPFPAVPGLSEFPGLFPGGLLTNITTVDRNMRTPYIQQFNGGVQFRLGQDTVLETSYVGTRGLNLFRLFAINQAYLASEDHPIRNVVTGMDVTTNTPSDAQLRAPFQGMAVGASFTQNQTVAQSSYHSLQTSLSRRWSRGLQFLASYTYSKSIDTASGNGGGSGVGGSLAPDFINDTSLPDGDQRDSRSSRGVSDFDRTHRFVLSNVWEIPRPSFTKGSRVGRLLLSGWQLSGIMTWMSGLPINIRDARGAELFFGDNGGGGNRPNWAPGATLATATSNIRPGYYFNPFAFVRAVVSAGQPIPSSAGRAVAGPNCPVIELAFCTDFGNVGRNPLRGPRQFNIDLAITKRFALGEAKSFDIRAEAFNLLNNVNFANPISNFNAAINGGAIDNTTGRIIAPGNFGKIVSTSNNPRIVQIVLKFHF
ncbi:MAG TPA: TonB-dependent receptor, partial [Pyrinomonadaceae bacterium]|nr:TonB-dependent receptor [Pyrinomonadaceae bacterium]